MIMEYKVKEVYPSEFGTLKKEWNQLEKGEDMTYYQSYHWYESIMKFMPEKKGRYGSVFLCIYGGGKLLLICPLWIIFKTTNLVNKPGVYLLGRRGWSDYLNVVYDDCPPEVFKTFFDYVTDKWKIRNFCLEQLKEQTRFYKYVSSSYTLHKDIVTTCVSLLIPENNEAYKKLLSKNSRQNIRTARNRLTKDVLNIRYSLDDTPDLEICKRMRAKRVVKKNKAKTVVDWLRQKKGKIKARMEIDFPAYLPFYADKDSHFMTAYINDELAAFFNYAFDVNHSEILLMAVGTNEKFVRYSPGVLLIYEYITSQIESKKIRTLDFTRGNEPYKYHLGGSNHLIHSLEFSL